MIADDNIVVENSLEIENILDQDVSAEAFPQKSPLVDSVVSISNKELTKQDTSINDEIPVSEDVHITALRARNERLLAEIAELKNNNQQRLEEYEKLYQLRNTQSEAVFAAYKDGAQKKFDALKQLVSSAIREKEDLNEQVRKLRKIAIEPQTEKVTALNMKCGSVPPALSRSPTLKTRKFTKDGIKPDDSAAVEINSLKVYAEKLQSELTEARQKIKTLTAALESETATASRSKFELEAERHLRQENETRAKRLVSELEQQIQRLSETLDATNAGEQKKLLQEKENIIFVQHAAIQLYQLLTRLAITHVEETKAPEVETPDDDKQSTKDAVLYQFNCLLQSDLGVSFEYLLSVSQDALLEQVADEKCQFVPQSSFQTVPSSPTDETKLDQVDVVAARKQIPEYLQDEVEFQVDMLPKMFDKLSFWASRH